MADEKTKMKDRKERRGKGWKREERNPDGEKERRENGVGGGFAFKHLLSFQKTLGTVVAERGWVFWWLVHTPLVPYRGGNLFPRNDDVHVGANYF